MKQLHLSLSQKQHHRYMLPQSYLPLPSDQLEHFVEKIIDEKKSHGRGGNKYLVRWRGQGPENDLWLPRKELKDNEALDVWLASRNF